ncbi:MarR family transcriptional regulator [Promicromonospora kroppenstedtii]|uniref:MarR family transcriptional regulator n=1 Tax=Promicromonospora kroppenstedtii TaxID=440482 RepID=UPI0004B08A57|nr:MarR family transcriptional regulator [Promicromonospora kroppenstedtii]
MTGARLNRSERERVAAGLATGLDYAEIARRLGRPTSTVTREVARNGGPDGYVADDAEAAARERARRPRTTPPTPEPDPRAVFLEEFAENVASTGVPRTTARVLVQIHSSDHGCTAADLIAELGVSRAAVSNAVVYLDGLRLIRREREPETRRERYVVGDDVWATSWNESVDANARWVATTTRGVEVLGPDTPAGVRLARAARFFSAVHETMAAGPWPLATGEAAALLRALARAGVPVTADQLRSVLTPDQRAALRRRG